MARISIKTVAIHHGDPSSICEHLSRAGPAR
jgi:hypothetical protein